jgi:hypothetical protein
MMSKKNTCIYANSHTQLDEHKKLFAKKKRRNETEVVVVVFLHRQKGMLRTNSYK